MPDVHEYQIHKYKGPTNEHGQFWWAIKDGLNIQVDVKNENDMKLDWREKDASLLNGRGRFFILLI